MYRYGCDEPIPAGKTCAKTYATEDAAMSAQLLLATRRIVAEIGYSEFVSKWCIYVPQGDERAAYSILTTTPVGNAQRGLMANDKMHSGDTIEKLTALVAATDGRDTGQQRSRALWFMVQYQQHKYSDHSDNPAPRYWKIYAGDAELAFAMAQQRAVLARQDRRYITVHRTMRDDQGNLVTAEGNYIPEYTEILL